MIEARNRGVKTGSILAIEHKIKKLRLDIARKREEKEQTVEGLRKEILSAEIEFIESGIAKLEENMEIAKKRAAGGAKGASRRKLLKAQKEAELQELEAAPQSPGWMSEMAEADEAGEAANAEEAAEAGEAEAEMAEMAEAGEAAEAGEGAKPIRLRLKNAAYGKLGAKHGALGGHYGKKGGRPKKIISDEFANLQEQLQLLPSRIRNRPKMRKGTKGGRYQTASLACQIHFAKDHSFIWDKLDKKNLNEFLYWRWQEWRTGVEVSKLKGYVANEMNNKALAKKQGIALTPGRFRPNGEHPQNLYHEKNRHKKAGVRKINPKKPPGIGKIWQKAYSEIREWFELQRARENYVDQMDLWLQFEPRLRAIIKELEEQKAAGKSLGLNEDKQLTRGNEILKGCHPISNPEKYQKRREHWKSELQRQVGGKLLMPNREVSLSLDEEQSRVWCNWRAHDKVVELAAFGSVLELSKYLRDPQKFINARRELVFEQRDQVPFWGTRDSQGFFFKLPGDLF